MKSYSQFVCQQCGYVSPSYMGKCPNCGEWNSLVESTVETRNQKPETSYKLDQELVKLGEVKSQRIERASTGFSEFDRVLGGGIVAGSIVLISGDPGIGKSTLLLQVAINVANIKGKGPKSVLYVTGEESAYQVKLRADRITKKLENVYVMAVSSAETIVAACEKVNPTLLIVDSIQTLTTERLSGVAGSIGQVRECAHIMQKLAKSTHVPIFIVGHVNKEGNIAGPKVLEHVVDVVLEMEGDFQHAFRLVRSVKNRFGSTFEVGVFEMQEVGMVEVTNPSKIFLEQRMVNRAGSCVCATFAGGRPILAEVQALTNVTNFGMPTRRVTGLDNGRVQIVIASLARAAKLNLSNLDIYVNVAGGLKIDEPACDLAVALAIASSVKNIPLPAVLCVFGEVGLLGELRPVANAKGRIIEAKRLGFTDYATAEKLKTLEAAVRYALRA